MSPYLDPAPTAEAALHAVLDLILDGAEGHLRLSKLQAGGQYRVRRLAASALPQPGGHEKRAGTDPALGQKRDMPAGQSWARP